MLIIWETFSNISQVVTVFVKQVVNLLQQ